MEDVTYRFFEKAEKKKRKSNTVLLQGPRFPQVRAEKSYYFKESLPKLRSLS